jgi:tRNA(Ile)-lysidine synthase
LNAANSFIKTQLDFLKKQIFIEQDYGLEIDIVLLNQLPQKHFCIHHWFAPLGFSADEVLKLIQASKGKVLYSSTHRMIRERERLVLTPLKAINTHRFVLDLSSKEIKLPISLVWETVNPTPKMNWKSHQAALDKSLLKKPLCLRKYEKGDYFYPSGMNGKKLLRKFFKDEKFTTLQKESQWLLCSGEDIVWLVGKRCDNRFTAKVSTGEILLIQLEQ